MVYTEVNSSRKEGIPFGFPLFLVFSLRLGVIRFAQFFEPEGGAVTHMPHSGRRVLQWKRTMRGPHGAFG